MSGKRRLDLGGDGVGLALGVDGDKFQRAAQYAAVAIDDLRREQRAVIARRIEHRRSAGQVESRNDLNGLRRRPGPELSPGRAALAPRNTERIFIWVRLLIAGPQVTALVPVA